MTIEIPLTKGYVAIIDDEDAHLAARKWHAVVSGDGYGYVYVATRDGGGKRIKLSRAIMNPPAHLVVDHIDHDTMNNRRANLRIVTQRENMLNHKDGQRVPFADGKEYLDHFVRSMGAESLPSPHSVATRMLGNRKIYKISKDGTKDATSPTVYVGGYARNS